MSWKSSLHTEVNDIYVSNPYPKLGEEVEIKVSVLKNESIKKIFLRTPVNGEVSFHLLEKSFEKNGLDFYSTKIKLMKKYVHYHFVIETEGDFYYFTRNKVSKFIPTEDFDFTIICDFENPSWVSKSVFYQIFPDRFNKSNQSYGVKDDEYKFDGHYPIEMDWNSKPLEYNEGHCLDFYNGNLKGIQEKIDYFKELGVNALYLNPILSGQTTHRYDCTDYFNVDKHLGGNEALAELSSELHKNDMKIMMDVSINHTGVEHVWFQKALKDKECEEREYYYFNEDNTYYSWLGFHTLPQLDFSSDKLRNILYKDENSFVQKFLKAPYSIDGWRFDVGNHTGRKETEDHCHSIWKEVRTVIKGINKDAYYLGEHWEDAISYLLGDEWDSPMNYYSCSKPIRRFMGLVDRRLWKLKDKRKKMNPSTGYELAEQINQNLNRLPNQIAFLQFNLIDSHDIFRLHNFSDDFDFDLYKGLVSLMFLLPGTPNIYYGDEIGIDGHLESDEGIRYPMIWDRDKWNMDYFDFYKKLCYLKRDETTLHTGSYKVLYADEDSFSFIRFNDEKIIFNLISRNEEKTLNINFEEFGIKEASVKSILTDDSLEIKNGTLNINLKDIRNGVFEIIR